MQELVDIGSVSNAGDVTVGGQSAVALKGNAGASGIEYIYVSLKKPYLPLGVSAQATAGRKETHQRTGLFQVGREVQGHAHPRSYVVATKKTFP